MKKHTNLLDLLTGFLIGLSFILAGCQAKNPSSIMTDQKTAGKDWKIIGPGAGGGVFIPTISPYDTNLVFSKGDMTGAFVTYDGGASWNLFNLMSVIQDFEFDPSDRDVVYAASRGYLYDEDRGSGLTMLYRSENRGKSWKVIYPDVQKIRPLEKIQSVSFLPSELVKDMPDGSIDKIKVDPEDNNRIYLGLSPLRPYIGKLPDNAPRVTSILVSDNRGKDWKLIARVPGTEVLGIFPQGPAGNKDELTVITAECCMKISRSTGMTRAFPLPAGMINKAEYGYDRGKEMIYAVSEVEKDKKGNVTGGIFRSDDGGENWTDINKDLRQRLSKDKPLIFRAVDVCERHPETVYLSVTTNAKGPDAVLKVRYEIYRTNNSGNTWEPVYSANAAEVLSRNFNDSWLNQSYGPGWGGDILTLGVAPTDPDICYATDFGQAYKTSDGGKNWSQVCSINFPDGSVTTRGLDLTCCYGVAFDPFDRQHLIISYIDIGLFHSFDRGKTWKHLVEGIPNEWVNTCYHITFDPAVKGRVWSTWADQHSLPRKSQFGDGLFTGRRGGVAYSEDGGKTWQKYNRGLPENSISTDLLVDPKSDVNARTLYLSTFNQGVFRSVDGGKNWTGFSKGLKDNRYAWQIRMAGRRIFLLCVRGWKGESSLDGKLYYSDDEALNWKEAVLPEGVTAPDDLTIDPADTGHMYLSCWPKHSRTGDICGGVYLTRDGCKSWKQCFDERVRVFAAAFYPHSSDTLFVNTFQNGAYRSNDGGRTWDRLLGYRFKWGHCPIPDPNNPGMLFLTTYGVSVYYGPDKGTPTEFGRIENLPDSWW